MVKNLFFKVSLLCLIPKFKDLIIKHRMLLNSKMFNTALRSTMIDLCNDGDLQGALFILKDIIQINTMAKSDDNFGNMTLRTLLRAVAKLPIVSISYIP